MKIDLNLAIALAALLLSLLSPIFSALITGHFRLKEKRLDLAAEREKEQQSFYNQHRAEVIERFISAAGAALKDPERSTLAAYGAAKGEIYLYVDKALWSEIDRLDALVQYSADNSEGLSLLSSICKQLSLEEVRPQREPEKKRKNKQK